jgi:hypothetical protein
MSIRERIWMWLLVITGVIAGSGFLERLLHPYVPCPRCGEPTREWSHSCRHCEARLSWNSPKG